MDAAAREYLSIHHPSHTDVGHNNDGDDRVCNNHDGTACRKHNNGDAFCRNGTPVWRPGDSHACRLSRFFSALCAGDVGDVPSPGHWHHNSERDPEKQ